MRKFLFVLAAVAVVIGAGIPASTASAAPALAPAAPQACGAPGDYPPTLPTVEPKLKVAALTLAPGTSSGTVEIQGAEPGAVYSGTLYSVAIPLPATAASAAGVLRFTGVTIPPTFQLTALHHIDLFRTCQVGSLEVCVTSSGRLGAVQACNAAAANAGANGASAGQGAAGSLARTGWDHLLDVLRAASLALGVGALLLYLRRRTEKAHA
jgi:hypothetical protein